MNSRFEPDDISFFTKVKLGFGFFFNNDFNLNDVENMNEKDL